MMGVVKAEEAYSKHIQCHIKKARHFYNFKIRRLLMSTGHALDSLEALNTFYKEENIKT